MRLHGGAGVGWSSGGSRGGRGGGVQMKIMTRKVCSPNALAGVLERMVVGIIQAMSRYRSNIIPVEGSYTLPQVLASYKLDMPEMLFWFYRREEASTT